MLKIAHIVNPVIVPETSDLYKAQPVTFRAMQIAREFALKTVDVHLLSAQYPEDRTMIPDDWEITPDLTRSVLDFGQFAKPRKLPLLYDILDRLYQATDAEYLIYTNVDIIPLPHFYTTINAIINAGYDAFVINRRIIQDHYILEDLPLMYAEIGTPHAGHDCFVFRKSLFPDFYLGDICIGVGRAGKTLLLNMICQASKFKEYKDIHLTFHIGSDETWKLGDLFDYDIFNNNEIQKVWSHFEEKNQIPGILLSEQCRPWPNDWWRFIWNEYQIWQNNLDKQLLKATIDFLNQYRLSRQLSVKIWRTLKRKYLLEKYSTLTHQFEYSE